MFCTKVYKLKVKIRPLSILQKSFHSLRNLRMRSCISIFAHDHFIAENFLTSSFSFTLSIGIILFKAERFPYFMFFEMRHTDTKPMGLIRCPFSIMSRSSLHSFTHEGITTEYVIVKFLVHMLKVLGSGYSSTIYLFTGLAFC